MRLILPVLAIALAAPAAQASSPDAWVELKADAIKACQAASDLKDAEATRYWLYFEDKAAVLLESPAGAKASSGPPAPRLCLFDKKARTVEVQEAAQDPAPPQKDPPLAK